MRQTDLFPWEEDDICYWIDFFRSVEGKWNITLISRPNSSLHRNDPQVCPFDKQNCPCCLSNLSRFAWKLSKDQRIRLFLWLVFTKTRHSICPSETLLLSLKLSWDLLPSFSSGCGSLVSYCRGRPARLFPSRGILGKSVFISLLMHLSMCETLVVSQPWERWRSDAW